MTANLHRRLTEDLQFKERSCIKQTVPKIYERGASADFGASMLAPTGRTRARSRGQGHWHFTRIRDSGAFLNPLANRNSSWRRPKQCSPQADNTCTGRAVPSTVSDRIVMRARLCSYNCRTLAKLTWRCAACMHPQATHTFVPPACAEIHFRVSPERDLYIRALSTPVCYRAVQSASKWLPVIRVARPDSKLAGTYI